MFEAHGTYPWKDWNNIWTYHTKFIPAGAAKLLIEQAIRCSGPASPHDTLGHDAINTVEAFKSSGFLNKGFRVVRVYMDDDVAKVVAVYSHDGVYHLIEAEEEAFMKVWLDRQLRPKTSAELKKEINVSPAYPNEYHLESIRGG